MNDIRFDTYYCYDAIIGFLHGWAEQYPQLCRVESIGKSYEGRDIPIAILTNTETGPDTEKPAFWVDANIHATEVAPSSAALYLINRLLTGYGQDERLTYALDSRTFYVVPRLNPDGAEWALADTPRYIRSSTKPYPREDELDGLHQEDIDGDGRILQMRLKDPNGPWKIHPEEPRLMIPREPDEPPGGDFYRILPEGVIRNYDGVMIELAPPLQGLDLNRNFPINWSPTQRGGGKFPGSEPEPRAAMDFIAAHPNITGAITFHTFSAVHLRPLASGPDKDLPTRDLRTYKKIGEKATELTGYPAVSVYHDFAYDPKEYIKGTFDDWMYEHLGVYAWTTEIWDIRRAAGLKDIKHIEWFQQHSIEDDLAILKWNDETLNGEGYIQWYPFEHPQLGQVELGGWHTMVTWRNPPYKLLEKEIAPLADFAIYHALISPRLELHSLDVKSNGDTHFIRMVLHNTGWLPTNVSQKALETKAVKELEVNIDLPDGAELLSGKLMTMLGQLEGRDAKGPVGIWGGDSTNDRAKAEWVVKAPSGGEVTLTARHERAGTVRVTVTLDENNANSEDGQS